MAMEREEATSLATGALKKVISARGKLQGNFYFVADGAGEEVVLIATLASRDKKGTLAVTQGRPFRKELKGARYARGSITFEDGKLVFTIHKGNANKKSVLDGFRSVLSREKGLGFLKKAVVTMASGMATEGEETESETLEENTTLDEATLQEADQSTSTEEISLLVEAQGDLSGLSDFFQKSDRELEAAFAQQVGSALETLQTLQKRSPIDSEAEQKARSELALLVSVSHDSLPQLGEDLPPELHQVLLFADALLLLGDSEEEEEDEEEETEEEEERDWGAELLAALQEAEQRYYAAGEPEEVASWLVKIEALLSSGEHEKGLGWLASEVEWRLIQAERNRLVQEEIVEATGGGRVDLGRLLLSWRQAEDTARQQLALFQNMVLTDTEVTADPRYPEIAPKVRALSELLPGSAAVQSALDTYITATNTEDRASGLESLGVEVEKYAQRLDADPRLKEIDHTAFGDVAVYSALSGAVQALRQHLSSASGV